MTGTRDPQQDGSIQAMLSDSGLEAATELRSALEQLRAVVPDTAPAPRADLAALLAAGASGSDAPVLATTMALPTVATTALPAATTTALPTVATTALPAVTTTALPVVASAEAAADESLPPGVTSLAERRGRKRRLAIVGGAVVGAMTLGAGTVAASSEDFRHSVSQSVSVIFQPAGPGAPAPEHVQPSPSSVPAFPAPAATSPAGTPEAVPSSTAPTDAARDGDKESRKQSGHRSRATPPAVGRDGILPAPAQRPGPSAPGLPGNGNRNGDGDDNEDLPRGPGRTTPTLPGVVPTKAPGYP
ncbi:hypothetical protein [Arthrobacter sp. NPDC058192]|uniref:hypothetical protein n=1 Tax=Arthrobacter sp. NPDC058192 TaxID=3346372 RepID=UPI0036EF8F94